MRKKIFIITPAFNASGTINQVFNRIPETVKSRIDQYVVVDDGSADHTYNALLKLRNQYPNLVILKHEQNKGYGAAEKTLLNHALKEHADIVVLLHADGQYSPEKIPEMIYPIEMNQAEIVQGSRILEDGALKGGMPFYKYIANRCLTAIENLAFGMKLAEFHSGFLAYSKKVLLEIPFNKLSDSFDFDLEMLVMAKTKGMRIAEVAIPTIYAEEISYLNPIKYGFDVLSVVKAYKKGKYKRI